MFADLLKKPLTLKINNMTNILTSPLVMFCMVIGLAIAGTFISKYFYDKKNR